MGSNLDIATIGSTSQPSGFVFNHTMIRVKNISASLDFYSDVLGFSQIESIDFPKAEFSIYFLAIVDKSSIPAQQAARPIWMKVIPSVLELTYNHGTEDDPGFNYHEGNSDPRSFGHICISTPVIKAACARLESLNALLQKRITEDWMKDIRFIKVPDGYWVEIAKPTLLLN